MTDKLKELEKEAVAEDKYTDNAAFELFVKDMIRLDLESIAKAYRNLSRMQKVKDVHTLQYYEEEFEKMSPMNGCTNREYYRNKV